MLMNCAEIASVFMEQLRFPKNLRPDSKQPGQLHCLPLNFFRHMKSLFFNAPVALTLGVLTFSFSSGFMTGNPIGKNTGSLIVRVNGVRKSKGVVRVVLYNSEKTFLSENGYTVADSAFARNDGTLELTLPNLPFGRYAVAYYEDKNQNGVIDMNMFHIPTEPYAFSNGVRAKWSIPDFNAVAFQFNQPGTHIEATLRNWSEQ